MTDDLRQRIADAIRAAAYDCDGDCGMSEDECRDAHLIQVASYRHGAVDAIWAPPEALADVVLSALDGPSATPPQPDVTEPPSRLVHTYTTPTSADLPGPTPKETP